MMSSGTDNPSDSHAAPVEQTTTERVTTVAPTRRIEPVSPEPHAQRERGGVPGWLAPLIGLLAVIASSAVHNLADILSFNGLTRHALTSAYPVPMQPASWTWFIWPTIWGLILIFFVMSFFQRGRDRTRVKAVAPLYALAASAGIAALVLAHYRNFRESLICAVVEFGLLALIFGLLQQRERAGESLSALQRFIIAAPFSLALAWSAVQVMIALQRWQQTGGWSGGPFGLRGWAVILLMIGVLLSALIGFSTHEALFPLGIAWADIGIAQMLWGHDGLLTTIAIVMTVFNVLIAGASFVSAFDARSRQTQPVPVATDGARRRSRLQFSRMFRDDSGT